jgi:GntR family transcriptional regulator
MAQQQPIYLQIADDLRKRIELGAALPTDTDNSAAADPDRRPSTVVEPDGDSSAIGEPNGQLPAALKPGSQLPTELALSGVYSASRNTIRDAIKRLISLGLVETRQGQGTFVARKIDPFVTYLSPLPGPAVATRGVDPQGAAYLSEVNKVRREAKHSDPEVKMQVPDLEVANRLRLEAGAQVVSRHQKRFIDGIPWSLQTTFFPMEFITKGATRLLMATDIEGGTVRYLADTLDIRQVGYRDWITARNPDKNEQEFFGLAHDATVFVIFRTGFDQTETPMRVTVTIFPVDRNQFIVDSGKVPSPQYGPEADSDSS